MLSYGLPVVFALFVWWASTGLIIFLDNLPSRTFRWSLLGATAMLMLALDGLGWTRAAVSLPASYTAFGCAMLAWGWVELTFYLGYVTGPRRTHCVHGCTGWRHFGHALQASLWHELAALALAGAVAAITWHAANQVGLWTLVVLWWMHQSARLNVFLGVRNIDEEFLPAHLSHLRSFFARRSMNPLFPVSVTLSTVVTVILAVRAAQAADPVSRTGLLLLATLMALAVLEHWLLMVPLPAARLWRWSMRARPAGSAA